MFKAGDTLKLKVSTNNPKPSSNRYRFVRYSRTGGLVVVGKESKGTLQYFGNDTLELA